MMAADLEVPEVELDYEDGRAMLKAAEFGLPGHVGLVNVSKFHKLHGFGREKIYEQLEAYSCLSQKKGKNFLFNPTAVGIWNFKLYQLNINDYFCNFSWKFLQFVRKNDFCKNHILIMKFILKF